MLLVAGALAPQRDSVYADSATAALVARARARHQMQDSLVTDYAATVHTRLRFAVGRSRFGRQIPLFADEQVARLEWSQPNDLRLEFAGRRQRALTRGVRGEVLFDRPWFFPRALGDSVRLLADEIPDRAALHPLAPGAEAYYRYAIADSLTVDLQGRRVRLAAIAVQPTRPAPALVAGRLWVDRETGEVTRFTFFFVGEYLFGARRLDSTSTRKDSMKVVRENRVAARAVRIDAELEYGLYEQRFWMPYRQLVTIDIEDIWLTGATFPIRFETTFSDYRINRGRRVAFSVELPDTAKRIAVGDTSDHKAAQRAAGRWSGGRWEVGRPTLDSLEHYDGWTEPLAIDAAPDDEERFRNVRDELSAIAQDLPAHVLGRSGRPYGRIGEFFRFNRVQGVSLGGGYAWEPGIPYTRFSLQTRYGFKDRRFLFGASVRRDMPGGLWELELARRLADVDPASHGTSFGNSLTALFAGHDNADYMLTAGGRLSYTRPLGRFTEWTMRAGVEDQRSVSTRSGSKLHDWFGGDGLLPSNPPIRDGTFAVWGTQLDHRGAATQWRLGADAVGGDGVAGARWWGDLDRRLGPARLHLAAGGASRTDVPQLLARAGGPRTVRGHDFGARAGAAMWAAQLEVHAPLRGALVPFVFADVGAAGSAGRVFRDRPLLAAGGGLALNLLFAELRLEVARSLGPLRTPNARVDLVFRAVR
jgi:hypothetical protein